MKRPKLALHAAALACAATACGEAGTRIVTPPPPEYRPRETLELSVPPPGIADAPPPPPPELVSTDSSDEWVSRSFKLQDRFARVFLVTADEARAPLHVEVAPPSLNAGAPAAAQRVVVDGRFSTIQAAIDAADAGDLVVVEPGRWAGFVMGPRAHAGDHAYVVVRGLGPPGSVVVDRPAPGTASWGIYLRAAHHVVIENLVVAGGSRPGQPAPGPRAGIMIDGAFAETGSLAHHVAISGVWSRGHREWGLHATDTHTVLVQDSAFTDSAMEHGAYVSDGSDDWVIRRNVFSNNQASGLQINLDPVASFEELLGHPSMRSRERGRTRAWAESTLELATKKLGARNFPDGRGESFLVEENVMTDNGRSGGAALNMASVVRSIVQNNLAYDNLGSGFALWNNDAPYDTELEQGAATAAPESITGPEALPMFGCQNVVVRNNTVVHAVPNRAALWLAGGSWGLKLYDNVLVNEGGAAVEIHPSSVYRLDATGNVIGRVAWENGADRFKSLATSLPDGPHNTFGVTNAALLSELVKPGRGPWIVDAGPFFRLDPARPDFRPKPGSTLLAGKGRRLRMPARDATGKPRTAPVIGAFVP